MPTETTETTRVRKYSGPAGVVFTPEELTEIHRLLTLNPNRKNAAIRKEIEEWFFCGTHENNCGVLRGEHCVICYALAL